MDEATEFHFWKQEFSMIDDGLTAFRAIKKLQEITHIVAMKNEGWEDAVEHSLSS